MFGFPARETWDRPDVDAGGGPTSKKKKTVAHGPASNGRILAFV